MTIPDNATLAALLDKRLTFFRDKDAIAAAQIADLTAERQELFAHIAELEWMKEQLPASTPPAPPVAAPAEASAEKSSRADKCADEILADYAELDLPSFPDDLPYKYHQTYGARALQTALNTAHRKRRQKSRAVLPPAEDASNRKDKVSASRPDDPQGDVGDNLDMPGFLKRTKEAAE